MTDNPKISPLFFVCLFSTLFLAIFYNTVTNMAGVYIASDLGGSSDISVYPMVFFGLGNALSIPLANPLADRIGPIKLLIQGLLIYTLFSIFCAIAPTFLIFNFFRLGLGLASGLFYILSRRLLLTFAPEEKQEAYSFVMIIMYVIVPVLGASFGAWVAYESHWLWIFYINEPIALFLAAYFWYCHRKKDPSSSSASVPFDKIGYLFFFIGLSCLITAATLSQELDWYRSSFFLCLIAIGFPSLLYFILRTLIHPHPLLALPLLKKPLLSYALFNLAILFSAYFGMIILIALWLNIYVNYTPLWIAVLLCNMILGGSLAYLVTTVLLRRFDPRFTLALAILACASSCYYSTYFDINVDFFHLAVARFLAGAGLGLFLLPILKLALNSDPDQSTPIFTLFQVVRSCSSSLGAALYVILWQRRQIFFHQRLGEDLTVYSSLTRDYFHKANQTFHLTRDQSLGQLNVFLDRQSTSLALNDALGCMGYILIGLLALLVLSFLIIPRSKTQDVSANPPTS